MFKFLDRIFWLEGKCDAQEKRIDKLESDLREFRTRLQTVELSYVTRGEAEVRAADDDLVRRFRGRNGLLSYKNLRRNPVDEAPEDIELERY